MFLDQPYNSKTLQNFNLSEETYLVNRYIITDYSYLLQNKNLGMKPFQKDLKKLNTVVLYGLTNAENDIRELDFPLVDHKNNWICFDMRKFYKVDKLTKEVSLKPGSELEYFQTRNALTGLWSVGYTNEMYNWHLPQIVFARWLASLISNKFGLSPKEENDIYLLATIYYSRLFSNGPRNHKDEIAKLIIRLRENYTSRGTLEAIYNESLEMESLESFCAHVEKITGNVRLAGFNVGVLFRLTQTSWIGNNYKQYLSISLEYPPVWIAMIYIALKSNFYKQTQIGKQADRAGKRNEGLTFMKSVDEFINAKYGVK